MDEKICDSCMAAIRSGAAVCAGCRGKIVRGATSVELVRAFNMGFALAALLGGAAWIVFGGISANALVSAVVAGLIGGAVALKKEADERQGQCRVLQQLEPM
jgi:hypothetical protein